MLNELDKRIIQIIAQAETPLTSKELALKCDVAINTIRGEIIIINEELQQHGFEIASKSSVGHYLEIINQLKAIPFIEKMKSVNKKAERMGNYYSDKTHYIVRKFLCTNNYITIEHLCSEFYCSKGTIAKDLDKVRKVLNEFKLVLKNKKHYGLIIEGSEWNIRQCLLFEHKIIKNSLEDEDNSEFTFKANFLATKNVNSDYYPVLNQIFIKLIQAQKHFYIPIITAPKYINYVLLAIGRAKYVDNLQFNQEQIARVISSIEFVFTQKFMQEASSYMQYKFADKDYIAVCMLIMSNETINNTIEEKELRSLKVDAKQLSEDIIKVFDYPTNFFSKKFIDDFANLLYVLKNKYLFNVFGDEEIVGYVTHNGIRSTDMCLIFSKFFNKQYGIKLNYIDALTAFYYFHSEVKRDNYCYYAQNIMVISQYGMPCAKSIATNIRIGYGKEIKKITACEFGENIDDVENYDVLVTDLDYTKIAYLNDYDLPKIEVFFLPSLLRIAKLNEYLVSVRYYCEKQMMTKDSFHFVNFKNKREVFSYIAHLLANEDENAQMANYNQFIEHDEFINLERNNELVFIPFFKDEIFEQTIIVLMNKTDFIWNKMRVKTFICYPRMPSKRTNQVVNEILMRFLELSPAKIKLMENETEDILSILLDYSEKS